VGASGSALRRPRNSTRRPILSRIRFGSAAYCGRVVEHQKHKTLNGRLLGLGAGILMASLVACGDDDPPSGGDFECTGNDCVCPSSGDCRIHCDDECNLQCAGSGDCDFTCETPCAVACTGSGLCVMSVADASNVQCPGSGGCDVDCAGDCTVECPGSGACVARCEPGFVCTIERCSGNLETCAGGVQVCNGACPPEP
jgi:hypothetical protein